MFTTDIDNLFDSIRVVAGDDVTARIRARSRPALGFRFSDQADRDSTGTGSDTGSGKGNRNVGSSYLDGLPRMPADVPWPESNGHPLQFRASIDLRGLPRIDDWPNQPDHGLLLFFGWDYSETAPGGQVLYVEDSDHPPRPYPRSLTDRPPSTDSRDWVMPVPVEPRALEPYGPGLCTPYPQRGNDPADEGPDSMGFGSLPDYVAIARVLGEYHETACVFQLLGIAVQLQSNPVYEPGWRLLAQIDTRDVFVMYFTIKDDDLANGNYDQVRGEGTCD